MLQYSHSVLYWFYKKENFMFLKVTQIRVLVMNYFFPSYYLDLYFKHCNDRVKSLLFSRLEQKISKTPSESKQKQANCLSPGFFSLQNLSNMIL